MTVKALRYYDEQGLLTPSARGGNGYRYYSEGDYEKARLIALLRELDFSIAEIRDVLQSDDYQADLPAFLQEKKGIIAQRIRRERALLQKIDACLQPRPEQPAPPAYQVAEMDFPPVTVAAIRYKGPYSDAGRHIGRLMKAVGGKSEGVPFQLYYDPDYREIANIALCVPVRQGAAVRGVEVWRLPAFHGIGTTHVGPYPAIGAAYKAVLDEAARLGLRCTIPAREIYQKGPGLVLRGNSSRYVTQIAVPCERESGNEREQI